jgi:hypothetical protein
VGARYSHDGSGNQLQGSYSNKRPCLGAALPHEPQQALLEPGLKDQCSAIEALAAAGAQAPLAGGSFIGGTTASLWGLAGGQWMPGCQGGGGAQLPLGMSSTSATPPPLLGMDPLMLSATAAAIAAATAATSAAAGHPTAPSIFSAAGNAQTGTWQPLQAPAGAVATTQSAIDIQIWAAALSAAMSAASSFAPGLRAPSMPGPVGDDGGKEAGLPPATGLLSGTVLAPILPLSSRNSHSPEHSTVQQDMEQVMQPLHGHQHPLMHASKPAEQQGASDMQAAAGLLALRAIC